MSFNRHPCETNEFWIEKTTELLKSKYISDSYRKRLEAIRDEAKILAGGKVESLHYPKFKGN